MNNKILISVIVPTVEMGFDIYIPNAKKVGAIKKYILKAISELTEGNFDKDISEVRMLNRATSKEYDNNVYVKDTDIRNGCKFIII